MLTKENSYKLLVDCIESLIRSESIDAIENISEETIILGIGSTMDSISFVTFITEVEDRLQNETGSEIYLVLNQIDAFNINNPNLTLNILSDYISKTLN
jgi:hypothetical protein